MCLTSIMDDAESGVDSSRASRVSYFDARKTNPIGEELSKVGIRDSIDKIGLAKGVIFMAQGTGAV